MGVGGGATGPRIQPPGSFHFRAIADEVIDSKLADRLSRSVSTKFVTQLPGECPMVTARLTSAPVGRIEACSIVGQNCQMRFARNFHTRDREVGYAIAE